MKTIVSILSYNMPQLTDKLYTQLSKLINIDADVEFIVLDNGSDSDKIAESTTHRLFTNVRLTGGMNQILMLAREKNADYVWLCTNDIYFEYDDKDPVWSMISKCLSFPKIGVIHPSLVKPVPNYAYDWMIKEPNHSEREGFTTGHSMVDIICPLYTKKALDTFDWKFDTRFKYGWGIDYLSAYYIRKAELEIAVDFDILVSHKTSAIYDAGKDKEFKNRQAYYKKALNNMNNVMYDIFHTKNWYKEYFIKRKFDV